MCENCIYRYGKKAGKAVAKKIEKEERLCRRDKFVVRRRRKY